MIRAIGWNLGQRGDIIMNTVVSRGFKEKYPISHLTLGIYKEYSDMKDLFIDHPFIDDVHIYDSYNDWPNQNDLDFLNRSNFNIIYNGMPQHPKSDWYNHCVSQTEEACFMNGIKPPNNLQCILTKWFNDNEEYKEYVAIAPFSSCIKKDLSISRANEIVCLIKDLGYNVLQLSSTQQPKLKNVIINNTNYFNSVVNMLSCKALVTINTGMSWVSSAYSKKTLGLYSIENWGYHNLISSSIYEPINPNAIYLRGQHPDTIDLELIKTNLKKIIER